MCGITGVVGSADRSGALESVHRMTDSLARRGPDSAGVEEWERAVLGHRRLAIFDLSAAGHQPMVTDNRRVGVVFNGAIYNFTVLRSALVQCGYRFRSGTDTEVLLHGYRAWGIDGLVRRLEGMFAFGLWDDAAGRLFLVRDRLGVKPLLYARRGDAIAFASTARALRDGGFTGAIDDVSVAEFLEFGFVTEERSIYEGVEKVAPAQIVEWRDGQVQTRSYWTPPEAGARAPVAFDDAVEHTEELLLQAVRDRLQADVPVGSLLSGGIDSGLVCWAIRELKGDVTAFTVATPGSAADESSDAEATARELGIPQRILPMDDFAAPAVDELITAYAEPFACSSALGMLRVSRAVAASAKVLLTGDGGDDVFLGYPRHRHLLAASRVARVLPPPTARWWRAVRPKPPAEGVLRRAIHFTDYAAGGLGAFLSANDGLPGFRAAGVLGERLETVTLTHRQRPWSTSAGRRVLADYLAHDRRTQFVSEYLTKVDGATMRWGLEARSPFFDRRLWEFASSLPVETRLRGGELKAILRELARRRVSRRLADGRKRGFTIPVEQWLAGRWRGDVEEALHESVLAREGWIRPQPALDALRATPASGRAPRRLWYLFVLERWMRAETGDRYSGLGTRD